MTELSGYQIVEQISKSDYSVIYRGIRLSDNAKVILKLPAAEFPPVEEIEKFKREYRLTSLPYGDRVIRVFDPVRTGNGFGFTMEDFGGITLASALSENHPDLAKKLSLAMDICEGLGQIHRQGIVHRDLNPFNILCTPGLSQLKLIDFGLAAELKSGKTQLLHILEGNYLYISPEQTGKINRSMDYRSDLYSLGVILYELFTGVCPFGDDVLETVYCHIAKTPEEPIMVNGAIPGKISEIIMKLLAKNPEERYQTTAGLEHDLRYSLANLDSRERLVTLEIGRHDSSDLFRIPQKLYGRDQELSILEKAFNALSEERTELILISGYSGVGKTSLINEMSQLILERGGRFISGKFSQLERNIPYSAIVAALRGLMRTVISETATPDEWRERLRGALGVNAGIISDLLPEVGQLIGIDEGVKPLKPAEAKNRFQLVFSGFLKLFFSKERPLVIFLDDLQWSDLSSLDLLKYLLSSKEIGNILIIGAYRDNEVPKGHPLLNMLEETKEAIGAEFLHELYLEPLPERSVNQLVAETLGRKPFETNHLSKYLYEKTNGNPFFTTQLLRNLYEKGAIRFNKEKSEWDWDLAAIIEAQISDNVIDFLIKNLAELSPGSAELLKKASCIGTEFDLGLLYFLCDSIPDIPGAIWSLIEKGFILPLNSSYRLLDMKKETYLGSGLAIGFRFGHDRIQQAVYSLVPDGDKTAIHRRIGSALLESCGGVIAAKVNPFELTNQLNLARSIIIDKKERLELLDLNLASGRKAKNSTAFDIAKTYFGIGKTLLTPVEWSEYPDRLFDLSLDYIESSFLAGESEDVLALCYDLEAEASTRIQKARLYALKAKILDLKGADREAIIDVIRAALSLFEITFPADPNEIGVIVNTGIAKMTDLLAEMPVTELVKLPRMTDPDQVMVMNLLFQALPAAFQCNLPLYMLIQLKMFEMTITYGITDVSCKNLVECGFTQGTFQGNYELGYQLGQAAFAIIEANKFESSKSPCYYIFASIISQWRSHYQESLEYFDMAIKSGLETGDIQHATYSAADRFKRLLYVGTNLEECNKELEKTEHFLQTHRAFLLLFHTEYFHYVIEQLTKPFDAALEDRLLGKTLECDNMFHQCAFGQLNVMLHFILGNYEAVDRWIAFTEPYLPSGIGLYPSADHCMFQALSFLKKTRQAAGDSRQELLGEVEKKLASLKTWADNCPDNFAHKYYLVQAELAVVRNSGLETIMELYHQALYSIRPGEFTNLRAMIYESMGRFWLSHNEEIIGKAYVKEAWYAYEQWGATAKIALMEEKYPQWLPETGSGIPGRLSKKEKGRRNAISSKVSLDQMSLVKSSQAISNEIKTERLLMVFMKIIMENLGAQEGCLMLVNPGDGRLEVKAIKTDASDEIAYLQGVTVSACANLCPEIVQLVRTTREFIIIADAGRDPEYRYNAYLKRKSAKSVLCSPILYQNSLKGILYLENNLAGNVFSLEHLELLEVLSSQIAISIENAQLYEDLERKVNERTKQLEILNKELKELTLHDPLTKLHNRRFVYEYLTGVSERFVKNKSMAYFKKQKRKMAIDQYVMGVFLIDLDHFKRVNDSYGHAVGDKVLVDFTRIIKSLIRADDFFIRWGGEEFLVILVNSTIEYLDVFSNKVHQKLRNSPINVPDQSQFYQTSSMGCAYLPFEPYLADLLTLEQTINLCDFALYQAKENGRECSAHLKLKTIANEDYQGLKAYLTTLSKGSAVDDKYLEMRFIRLES